MFVLIRVSTQKWRWRGFYSAAWVDKEIGSSGEGKSRRVLTQTWMGWGVHSVWLPVDPDDTEEAAACFAPVSLSDWCSFSSSFSKEGEAMWLRGLGCRACEWEVASLNPGIDRVSSLLPHAPQKQWWTTVLLMWAIASLCRQWALIMKYSHINSLPQMGEKHRSTACMICLTAASSVGWFSEVK